MDNQIVIDELLSSLNPDTETFSFPDVEQEETPVSVVADVQADQFVYADQDPIVVNFNLVPDEAPNPEGYPTQGFYDVALEALDRTGLNEFYHYDDAFNLQFNDQAHGAEAYALAGMPFGDCSVLDVLTIIQMP